MTGLLESVARKLSLVWAHDRSVRSFSRSRRSPARLAIQRHRKVRSCCQRTLEYALLLVRFGLWRGTQSDTQRRHRKAAAAWSPSSQPDWLTEHFYLEKIQPALASVSNSAIASRLGVSRCCASRIRSGKRRSHPRHWQALALLSGANSHGAV
jgi:hypothetical protein